MGRARIAIGWMLVVATALHAQPGSRLGTQLDAATRATVQALVDSAKKAGLPGDALANRALEAAGHGADDAKIVASVRSLAAELGESRKALGKSSRPDEIEAGATALHAGVVVADLKNIRQAGGQRALVTPLMVLTDFVSRGVPPSTAAVVILQLAKAGVRDSTFSALQRSVRQDIEHGADPSTAAMTRARGATLHAPAPPPVQRPHQERL
jgi:hypothetical protein